VWGEGRKKGGEQCASGMTPGVRSTTFDTWGEEGREARREAEEEPEEGGVRARCGCARRKK